MESIKSTLLCVGVVAMLLFGFVGSGVTVSPQAHSGENNRFNGVASGNGQHEQVEQQTENANENKSIRNQQREEAKGLDDEAKGPAPGQVKKEISLIAATKVPVAVVHGGQGFALDETDDEFHVLRIHIVNAKRLQQMKMRELIEANKTIEEIRTEIMGTEWVSFYQGYLRLGEISYRLDNISVGETGTDRSVDADVVALTVFSESAESIKSAGTISITARDYEGVRIGDGALTITEGAYQGRYRVLLTISHSQQELIGQ